ncbi:hypothetical protein EDB19DRAFT_1648728, partial [Suillus lakei]
DVHVIIDDNGGLEKGILPALQEYNIMQFTMIEVPGEHHQVNISLNVSGYHYSMDPALGNSQ